MTERIEDLLRAAKDEADQVIGGLKRENDELRDFGERIAMDKLQLTKQNEHLVERVMELETFISENQSKLVDDALDMLEGIFAKYRSAQ